MTRNNHQLFTTPTILLLTFAAVGAFVLFFFYGSCGQVDSTLTPSASASPTPGAGTRSPAPANQTSPAAAQPNAETAKQTEVKIQAITGTVKKEGSGEVVTDAVVVLFTGDKRGSTPRVVDASTGQFRFQDVPLKTGVTYSLQTKVPGLCGEEVFSLESVNEQAIHRDLVLKPCQNQVTAQQTTQSEQPGLTRISDGLSGMLAPLNSMKVWMQILATTWILTMIMLLVATLIFMIVVRRQLADARKRIDVLFDWQRKSDNESQKQTHDRAPSTALLNVPAEVSQILKQGLAALEKIAAADPGSAVQTDDDRESREESAPRPAPDPTPVYASPSYGSLPQPTEWYRDLFKGEARNPAPLYVEINNAVSETDPLHQRRICFDERHHGSFVLFREGEAAGWIFPRPGSTLVADHHEVFGKVDQKNVEYQEPKRVIFEDGYWKLVLP